jgi:DNA replication factor GINS
MYNELYAAWKREITQTSLGALPADFYARMADYIKRIKKESTVDQKNIKSKLLDHEARNVKRMVDELLRARYKKIIKTISKAQKMPLELLTVEETEMTETFATFADAYQKFARSIMQGQSTSITQPAKIESEPQAQRLQVTHKRVTLRFVKGVPAIMGADMKSYGPFAAEDVASMPELNAKILVKQGLAVLVEVS